eukprot:scaffold11709_cov51-Phaeocystis_antarctica.AAC.1
MFRSASAFNQPLSLDTSSVTTMYKMFSVRSSQCPAPNCSRALSPARCVRSSAASRLPSGIPRSAPHAFLSALGSTRRRLTSR